MEKENQRLKTELQSKETELQTIKIQKVSGSSCDNKNEDGMFVGRRRTEAPRTGRNY